MLENYVGISHHLKLDIKIINLFLVDNYLSPLARTPAYFEYETSTWKQNVVNIVRKVMKGYHQSVSFRKLNGSFKEIIRIDKSYISEHF